MVTHALDRFPPPPELPQAIAGKGVRISHLQCPTGQTLTEYAATIPVGHHVRQVAPGVYVEWKAP